ANRYPGAKALADDLRALKFASENANRTPTPRPSVPAPDKDETKLWQMPHRIANQPLPWMAGVLAAAAIVISVWLIFHGVSQKTPASHPGMAHGGVSQDKSIAVLPFDNFSAEADTEYLSDG